MTWEEKDNLREEILAKIKKHEKEIDELYKQLREIPPYTKEEADEKWHRDCVRHKACYVCAHRDAKSDNFIPDSTICLHPSNQYGHDMYKCLSSTCGFWEEEKRNITN